MERYRALAIANEGPPDFARMMGKFSKEIFPHQNPEYPQKVYRKLFEGMGFRFTPLEVTEMLAKWKAFLTSNGVNVGAG